VRIIAVDWSGMSTREAEYVWVAEVRDGELATLENGRSRNELVEHIIDLAQSDPEMIVGFDFAFSFPKWWCDSCHWTTERDVWRTMSAQAGDLLARCGYPFWGQKAKTNPHPPDRQFRRTEEENKPAKSVFQINGGGAVGTGSLRGMPYLHVLAERGFKVWPFDSISGPSVIEIYPRALTGALHKNRWLERHALLQTRFPSQPTTMLERAAGSEDAFDAAVSALVMADHRDRLAALTATTDPEFAIEGRIWRPEP
jgi:Protein of unknown function (DUF429)